MIVSGLIRNEASQCGQRSYSGNGDFNFNTGVKGSCEYQFRNQGWAGKLSMFLAECQTAVIKIMSRFILGEWVFVCNRNSHFKFQGAEFWLAPFLDFIVSYLIFSFYRSAYFHFTYLLLKVWARPRNNYYAAVQLLWMK